jgi:hypothetical protein
VKIFVNDRGGKILPEMIDMREASLTLGEQLDSAVEFRQNAGCGKAVGILFLSLFVLVSAAEEQIHDENLIGDYY